MRHHHPLIYPLHVFGEHTQASVFYNCWREIYTLMVECVAIDFRLENTELFNEHINSVLVSAVALLY